jgi:hypothetical protein
MYTNTCTADTSGYCISNKRLLLFAEAVLKPLHRRHL